MDKEQAYNINFTSLNKDKYLVYLTDDDFFVECNNIAKVIDAISYAVANAKHTNQYIVVREFKHGNFELFLQKYLGDI